MSEIIIEIISALIIFILIFGLIYATMSCLLRRNFRRLQKEFGGQLKFKFLMIEYSLQGIKLTYTIGSPYSAGGTILRVQNLPEASINVSLSSKKRLFNIENNLEKSYTSDQVELDSYKSLSKEIEEFVSEMKSNKGNLTINQNEFSLVTEYSPFYYQKIENCLRRLMDIKKIIDQKDKGPGFVSL